MQRRRLEDLSLRILIAAQPDAAAGAQLEPLGTSGLQLVEYAFDPVSGEPPRPANGEDDLRGASPASVVVLPLGDEQMLFVAGAEVERITPAAGGTLLDRAAAEAVSWRQRTLRTMRHKAADQQLIALGEQLNRQRSRDGVLDVLIEHATRVVPGHAAIVLLRGVRPGTEGGVLIPVAPSPLPPDASEAGGAIDQPAPVADGIDAAASQRQPDAPDTAGIEAAASQPRPDAPDTAVAPAQSRPTVPEIPIQPFLPLDAQGIITAAEVEGGRRYAPLAPLFRATGALSIARVPLGDKGLLVLVERRTHHALEPEDWFRFHALARHAAAALDRVQLREQTQALSLTDPVTGLGNRRKLEVLLPYHLAAAQRGAPLTLVVLELLEDRDEMRDASLHLLGECLRRQARASDILARYGTNRFVALLPNTSADGAQSLIRRIGAALGNAVTTRAGAAAYASTASTLGQLLEQATGSFEDLTTA